MKIVDLFAGCGGLSIGFHKEGFRSLGFVEWDSASICTLKKNFANVEKTEIPPAFFHQDIRKYEEYLEQDTEGHLIELCKKNGGIDGVIGGPPCQAYSMAGRVRDPNNMKQDYRNYLFEAYCRVLEELRPKFFVFENVPGLLSSKPNGEPITKEIEKAFELSGYYTGTISKNIMYNLTDFGGSQNRKRVIIFGLLREHFLDPETIVINFHDTLRSYFTEPSDVQTAIGDLPKLYPLPPVEKSRRKSHMVNGDDPLHVPRFHSERDISIFKLLATDAVSKNPKYNSTKALKQLYFERVGKKAAVHKYYVLRNNQPSNLIPAHLYKDGLRHIHPDPKQARSITAREAARLQTFPDEYQFEGSRTDFFRMIGNAVPPLMASYIAKAVKETLYSHIVT